MGRRGSRPGGWGCVIVGVFNVFSSDVRKVVAYSIAVGHIDCAPGGGRPRNTGTLSESMMFVLLGTFHDAPDVRGIYCVDDPAKPTEQFLLSVDGDIEEDAPMGPVFMTEGAAHRARLNFRGHRISSDNGCRIIWTEGSVVELNAAKVKALVESVPNYREAYREAILLGLEWAERDPRRGAA